MQAGQARASASAFELREHGWKAKWLGERAGERYARVRFASERAADRDPRIVERLLREELGARLLKSALDVPCGTGRLRERLRGVSEQVTGVDLSRAMLAQIHPVLWRLQADVTRLPFREDQFECVVCCRLFHHLRDRAVQLGVARELLRVSSELVVASFWDSGSLPAWRTRAGLKRAEERFAVSREHMTQLFAEAGGSVVAFRGTLRFLSQQTFVLVRKRRPGA
jgi:SAM-dependent methyltransferase